MGSTPSKPNPAQSNPAQLPAMPARDKSRTNSSAFPSNAAANRVEYAPLQSTWNPTENGLLQRRPTNRSSASREAQKRVASVVSRTEEVASGSRQKHTPLVRGDSRRNSQRSSRPSTTRTPTPDDEIENDVPLEEHESDQSNTWGIRKTTGNVPSQKTSLSPMVTPLPPIDRAEVTGKSPVHFCSECPHCRRKSENKKSIFREQLAWITDKPEGVRPHIDMDEYDEDAVQNRFVSEYGSLPGRYSYLPNIAIQEKESKDQNPKRYYTSPLVARLRPPIAPTRTPYLF